MTAKNDKHSNESQDTDPDISVTVTPLPPIPQSSRVSPSSCSAVNVIDHTGMCLSCNNVRALDRSIACFMCSKQFHAICRGDGLNGSLNNVNCNQTFHNQFTKRIEKNDVFQGIFLFICSPCKTDYEHKNAASLQSHVHCLERKVDNMESSLSEIKSLLTRNNVEQVSNVQNTPVLPHDTDTPRNCWEDTTRANTMRDNLEIAIDYKPSDDQTPFADVEKLVLDNGIRINRKYTNKNSGETVFVLPTKTDAVSFKSKFAESFPDVNLREKQPLQPTISVSNINEEISADDLKNRVINCHPEVKQFTDQGDTFNVLKIQKQKNSTMFYALIRVSNNIRKFIDSIDNRLYIGQFSSCKVYDHFRVKRCDTCQKLGHFKANCTANVTCLFCSGNHSSNQCSAKDASNFVPTCSNCKSSPDSTINGNHNHCANDSSCPSYINAQKRLRLNIAYYSSKN